MKTENVTCDNCGRDITRTSNCEDYRIALMNERITSRGGSVTAMGAIPPLNQTYHFCGMGCLKEVVNNI